jgi:hypothetical protein
LTTVPVSAKALTVAVSTPTNNLATFQSDDVVGTARNSSNAADSTKRNRAFIGGIATPNHNRAIFQSDGVFVTASDSGNAAKSSSRNGDLAIGVPTPSHNSASDLRLRSTCRKANGGAQRKCVRA